MYDNLLSNIARHVRLNDEETALFRTFWSEKKLRKGDYLLRNGEVCRYDNYVVTGALKAFYIHPQTGKDEILFFSVDDWWATDMDSFTRQAPSIYNIQALKDTTLLQIHHQAFDSMLTAIPQLERYFRTILQTYLGSIQRRIIMANTFDAAYRYRDFLERYPGLPDKIPQYLIASYLGISPEFLSRLRKRKKY